MSKDIDQAVKSLKNNGNFGDATNIVFDGTTVKAATPEQLKAVSDMQKEVQGGVEPTEDLNLHQLTVEKAAADALKADQKK